MGKNNSQERKKELDKRLSDLSSRHRNDTLETRRMIAEDVQVISGKHNDDMKTVTKVVEGKFELLKHVMDTKINETTGKEINKTLVRIKGELSKLGRGVTLKISNNTALYTKELNGAENMMRKSINTSKVAFLQEYLQIKKHINEQYTRLSIKLDDTAKGRRELESKIHNNTAGYKKGLNDLTSNLKTCTNKTRRDLKVKLARVEEDVDEKYVTLRKEVEETISKTAEDVGKEMKKKVDSKYDNLEKEVNSKISKIEGELKKTIESVINQKYEKMKKEVSVEIKGSVKGTFDRMKQNIEDLRKEIKRKAWPEGHFCLFIYGIYCPYGFTHYYPYYCCK